MDSEEREERGLFCTGHLHAPVDLVSMSLPRLPTRFSISVAFLRYSFHSRSDYHGGGTGRKIATCAVTSQMNSLSGKAIQRVSPCSESKTTIGMCCHKTTLTVQSVTGEEMTGEDIDCFYDTFDAAPRACTRAPSSIDTNYLSSQLLAPQISTQASPASSNRLCHQATDDIGSSQPHLRMQHQHQ